MRLYEKFACILIILSFCNSNILASEEQDVKQEILKLMLKKGSLSSLISNSHQNFKNDLIQRLEQYGYNKTEELDSLKTKADTNLKDHLKPNILDPTLGPMGFVSWYDVIKGALLTFLQSTIDNSPIPIDEDDFVIRLLASMAPILGKSEFGDISDACSDASWTYLINMFAYQQMWALQMFDSSGKLPDGIYTRSMDICDVLDQFGNVFAPGSNLNCNFLELSLNLPENTLSGLLNIPLGNTHAFGSYEGCLAVKTNYINSEAPCVAPLPPPFNITQTCNPLSAAEFNGSWLPMSVVSTVSIAPPQKTSRMASGISIIGGLGDLILANITEIESVSQLVGFVNLIYMSVGEFKYATCIPDVCTYGDASISNYVMYSTFNATTLPMPLGPGNQVTVDYSDIAPTEENKRRKMDSFAISMIVIFGIIAFFMLVGTLVETWELINPFPILAMTGKDQQENMLVKALRCFSIYSNGKQILNTDTGKGHLNSLSGIRSISMCWIIYGHLYLIANSLTGQGYIENRMDVRDLTWGNSGWYYEVLLNSFPSVDTFFFMSGLLVAYLSFGEMEKGRFNLKMFYIHRYIRLTTPLALAMAFMAAFPQYMSFGPFYWESVWPQAELCRNNGWQNLLYINNFYKQEQQCLAQTWYLANDMQFYILSPLILIPLWKKPKYGFTVGAIIYTILTFIIGFLVVNYDIQPTNNFITAPQGFDMIRWFYDMPYVRFQPYLIGIFFGYLFYKTKRTEFKIPHALNLMLWQLSLLTMVAVIFGLGALRANENFNGKTWTVAESVIYNCFHKTAWSLALGWIVFSCHKGYGGLIDDFLSWKAFVPLSKLTYGAYLSHIPIQFIVFYTQTSPIYFSDFLMSQYFIGIACFTFGTAFVQALVSEVPFVRLEKLLLGGPQKPKIETEKLNGHVNVATKTAPEAEEKKPQNGEIISSKEAAEIPKMIEAADQKVTEIAKKVDEN